MPTWALEQKVAANREVIAVMCARLERGEAVVPMYGPLGLVWLQRQAEIAEELIRARAQPPPASWLPRHQLPHRRQLAGIRPGLRAQVDAPRAFS